MIRAALFDGPGQPLRSVELAAPRLANGEVLVRGSLATICGSDLHTIEGKRKEPTPCVLGHETVGVIEDINGDVRDVDGTPLRIGDRIVWSVAASCGHCLFCNRDLPQKCETLKKYGHARHDDARGPLGGFASHVHLWPGTAIVKVKMPDVIAAPASCATATVAACLRCIPDAKTVLVLGAGMLGITACAMLKSRGHTVSIVESNPERQKLAASFGASRPVSNTKYDATLEFTGSTDLTLSALDSLQIGGTLVLAGAVFPTPPLALAPERIIRNCWTIRGVHNYHPCDLKTAVGFLEKHHAEFPFESLVARTFDDVNEAVEYARRERPLRVGVKWT